MPLVSAKPVPANGTSKPRAAPVATEGARAAGTTFQRIRVGKNEVDYIADDVTIRYFTPSPTSQRVQGGDHQINIGTDVTLRYFGPHPLVVPPTRPVPSAAQPVERSLPGPEKAGSPALAR